nr:hypothetical protein [Clostridiales bacterium]
FESDDIYLNFSTSAYGYVKVKIAGSDGSEIFLSGELYGNELSRRLSVKGLSGKTGRIEIELCEADLYAIGSDMSAK